VNSELTNTGIPSEAADHALVARARTGDFHAFEELVYRYRNDVFRLAFYYVHNREDAWDLAQEVFTKAFKGIRRFRGQGSFRAWLLRITANHCKDFLKKRKLPTVSLDAEEAAEPSEKVAPDPRRAIESKELGKAIQAAIDALPEKHRRAFLLREMEDLSYSEMAVAMGCSQGTVMSRLHHARKKLQSILADMGVVEGLSHDR